MAAAHHTAILKRQGEIRRILRDYGRPLLNEQGELISLEAVRMSVEGGPRLASVWS